MNIYHKGRYRYGEWVKHLRPFLKRAGNKRWRKDSSLFVRRELEDFQKTGKNRKRKKTLKVKLTLSDNERIHSCYELYSMEKQIKDSVKRNRVVRAFLISKEKIIQIK